MEPLPSKHFLSQNKQINPSIPFYFSNSSEQTQIHLLTGYPMLPLIGKYHHNGYNFDEILLVLKLECQINEDQIEGLKIIPIQEYPQEKQWNLQFPKEVEQLILNIPEQISHNSGQSEKQQKYEKSASPASKIPKCNPEKFQKSEIWTFYWVIHQANCLSTTVQAMKYYQKSKKSDQNSPDYYNLVPHSFLFKELEFMEKPRYIKNTPVIGVSPQNGCKPYESDSKKALQFNEWRSEYFSMHLQKYQGSLMLSPNNLRLVFNEKQEYEDIPSFWNLYLNEQGNHSVFWHWRIYPMQSKIVDLIMSSSSVEQLVNGIESLFKQKGKDLKFVLGLEQNI